MHKDKWQDIKAMVKEKFEVISEETKEFEESPGQVEILIFESPQGTMKFEFTERPVVLDKKTHHSSHRIGGRVKVDYIYSDDEKSYTFKAYREADDGEWEEMKGEAQAFSV